MYSSSLDSPAIEIIKGIHSFSHLSPLFSSLFVDKLYWISGSRPPQSQSTAYFFNVDLVRFLINPCSFS
jgi:hypothetical protein